MSVSEITARIGQIQSQLALLAPRPVANPSGATTGTASSSAAFAASLDAAARPAALGALGALGAEPAGAGGTGTAGAEVVAEARKYLGLPYVWGGTDPRVGLDCSGLVQLVYRNLGYELPRVSYQQAASGRPVASMAEAQPGDLLAWDNSSRNNGVDHIAIYIGGGKMIEARRTGLDVRIIDVPSTPDVIRRILPESAAAPARAMTGAAPVGTAGSGAAVAAVPYAELFNAAGARHGVEPSLLAAIARQESAFRPDAVSPAGAQGLMQLMPATARGLGVSDSFDPTQAVDGAARLMRSLLDRFGSTPLALAAYNAGPGAVLRYGGIPPYAETQNYVRTIMGKLG